MESTEKAEYLQKEPSCDWKRTNGRDATRSRFATQRKYAEFLGYKRILFVGLFCALHSDDSS